MLFWKNATLTYWSFYCSSVKIGTTPTLQSCQHLVTEVKGIVGMCDNVCVPLKCTNMRKRTAQLETYAVLRQEEEECVYMRKMARERWRLKIGTQVALPPFCASFLSGINVIVKIRSLADSVHS